PTISWPRMIGGLKRSRREPLNAGQSTPQTPVNSIRTVPVSSLTSGTGISRISILRGAVNTAALVFIAIFVSVRCSDEKLQDRHLLLAVHEQDLLVRDPDAAILAAKLVDRSAAPGDLLLAAHLNQNEVRPDSRFRIARALDLHVRDDPTHAWLGILRHDAAALEPRHAIAKLDAVVVDDRDLAGGIGILMSARHPVHAVVGPECQPFLVAMLVHEPSFAKQESLHGGIGHHLAVSGAAHQPSVVLPQTAKLVLIHVVADRAAVGQSVLAVDAAADEEPLVAPGLQADLIALHDLDVVGRQEPGRPEARLM